MNEKILSAINQEKAEIGITSIEVEGFKSLGDRSSIEVRPLTILAGANSSGKSSIMQPLLMMKQTLEAPYDPGALLLDGPNVKYTSVDQFLSKRSGQTSRDNFIVKLVLDDSLFMENTFEKNEYLLALIYSTLSVNGWQFTIKPEMSREEIMLLFKELNQQLEKNNIFNLLNIFKASNKKNEYFFEHQLIRDRFLFYLDCQYQKEDDILVAGSSIKTTSNISLYNNENENKRFKQEISKVIHVPGVRGNPERTYKITAIGSGFPGNFEAYVASIIQNWQDTQDERLIQLCQNLENLGLTGKVGTKIINGVQMEIQVSNLPRSGGSADMVNIADVGFGVSQTLPVLVALLVAEPGQLVYLEQPEIHLHPRAQEALAQVLADAANRGVRVVLETHSELLLLAVQSLVAEGDISPEKVKLHWFTRREDGMTEINSADLDKEGAFGDWPEDFSDISLNLESRYIDAAEAHFAEN